MFITVLYIHPHAITKTAASVIYDTVAKLENIAPDAPKLILEDFNGCALKNVMLNFYQYVNCRERTLDLCLSNIKDAYRGYPKPPVGGSDHQMVHLVPHYKQAQNQRA